jgi:hypothetical protein
MRSETKGDARRSFSLTGTIGKRRIPDEHCSVPPVENLAQALVIGRRLEPVLSIAKGIRTTFRFDLET